MRGQTLAGSASHQGTQHSSHGPSIPPVPSSLGAVGTLALPQHLRSTLVVFPGVSVPTVAHLHNCRRYCWQYSHAGLCQADVDPVPAQVAKGSSKEVLALPVCTHRPHLPPSYLGVGRPHIQSTTNINITNTTSGSSCSFTHATRLSFLKMISVHLFCFTGTCHHVASVCSFSFSSLLRSMPVFNLKLIKEFSSEP